MVVDLRRPVSIESIDGLRTLGLSGEFGVITACDPMGAPQTTEVNQARTRRLQKEIEADFGAAVPLDACSVDGSHCEASFALAAARERIVSLAIRHDQLGIFWFDSSHFWIVPARSSVAPVRLPITVEP